MRLRIEAAFPLAEAGTTHDEKHAVKHAGQGQVATEIKWDVNEVRGDPEKPVLESFSAEEILRGEAENGGERIPKRGGAIHGDEESAQAPGADGNGEQEEDPFEAGGSGNAQVRAVLATV